MNYECHLVIPHLYFQGDREGQTKFDKIPHNYSAFRSDDYGYTLINIFNGTHITMDQTSIDKVHISVLISMLKNVSFAYKFYMTFYSVNLSMG